MGTFSTKLILL